MTAMLPEPAWAAAVSTRKLTARGKEFMRRDQGQPWYFHDGECNIPGPALPSAGPMR
jgi:hypothetical protein